MARKYETGTLIHCESCGDDFSATYRRCPFCGAKPGDQPTTTLPHIDEYIFEGGNVFDDDPATPAGGSRRAGKRLAGSIHEDIPAAVNWTRLITFLCSLVIIAAALVIVFTWVYPAIQVRDPAVLDDPSALSQAPVLSPPPTSELPPSSPVSEPPAASQTPVPTQPPVVTPAPVGGSATALTLNKTDFTLKPDEAYTIRATVSPSGWNGTVSWTSSDPSIASVDGTGRVVNVNSGGQKRSVTITCTAGGQTATCIVFCNGGSGNSTPSPAAALTLNKSDVSIVVDESFTLKAQSGSGVVWTSSDPSIATVDASGKVTGTGSGRATITGTSADGAVGTCIVRVRNGG